MKSVSSPASPSRLLEAMLKGVMYRSFRRWKDFTKSEGSTPQERAMTRRLYELKSQMTTRLDEMEAKTGARLEALGELMQQVLLATGGTNDGPRVRERSERQAPPRPAEVAAAAVEQGEAKATAAAANALKFSCVSAPAQLSVSPRMDMGSPIPCDAEMHLESEDSSDGGGMVWSYTGGWGAGNPKLEPQNMGQAETTKEASKMLSTGLADAVSAANTGISLEEPTGLVLSERPICWPGVGLAAAERRDALRAAAEAARVELECALSPSRRGVMGREYCA